jgi:hypothetical protein
MDTHKNAALTPKGREGMVRSRRGAPVQHHPEDGCQMGRTLPHRRRRWIARPLLKTLSLPSQTAPATCAAVEVLRRQRYTGIQIAVEVGVSPATVSRILRRLGLNRLLALEPAEPVRRYEREHPGEIIHIDIKKLGRFEQIGHRVTGDRKGQSNSRGVGWETALTPSATLPRLFLIPPPPDARPIVSQVEIRAICSLGITH